MIELSDGNVNLLIGPEQQAAFQHTLETLTAKEGVACVLLIDTAGKIIAGAGGLGHLELATVAALAAGDFATTRALAHRVGEKEFSLVFQRERELNVYLQAVGEESLLVVLFDQAQGLGPVRVLVRQVQADLRHTLDECPRAVVGPDVLQATVEDAPATPATPAEAERAGQTPAPASPATGKPAASPKAPAAAAPSKLVKNPPADLIRKFWRIKTLAEDCVKAGVPTSAAKAWREARDLIGRVATTISAGEAAETRKLLADVERILMAAYEGVIAERKVEDEDLVSVQIWHQLVDQSAAPFADVFGERTASILGNVDRDSVDRHPDVLGRAVAGHLPDDGLAALRSWPKDRRRQAVARAFLDLLLNRLWVTDKLLGRAAGDALVERWRTGLAARTDDSLPPGLKPALGYLFAQALRRSTSRKRSAPAGPSESTAAAEGGPTSSDGGRA
ncbi:MAG: roadblock/LC7 domain-containing protein [Candidatus Coatesbacteria bacterium]